MSRRVAWCLRSTGSGSGTTGVRQTETTRRWASAELTGCACDVSGLTTGARPQTLDCEGLAQPPGHTQMNGDRRSPGLANVFATSELWRRQARQPDYRAENAALRTLAPRLVDPVTDFSVLSDLVIDLCRANGAAVSLLERNQSGDWIFRWTHVAGDLGPPTGGSVPRDFSPCGVAIERGGPQLFRHPELFFPSAHCGPRRGAPPHCPRAPRLTRRSPHHPVARTAGPTPRARFRRSLAADSIGHRSRH